MSHTHRCSAPGCDTTWMCDGARVDNWDGFPSVVCRVEERAGTTMLFCEDCQAKGNAAEDKEGGS